MPFSFSSMRRKSRYLAALSYMAFSLGSSSSRRRSLAMLSSSTSHRATMFCERQPRVSAAPMPPTPTQAMLSVSLGAFLAPFFLVAPTTWRGTTMSPAAAVEAAPMNFRRLQDGSAGVAVFFVSSMFRPSLSKRFGDRRNWRHRGGAGVREEGGVSGRRVGDDGHEFRHCDAKRAYSTKPRGGSNETERGRIGNGGGPAPSPRIMAISGLTSRSSGRTSGRGCSSDRFRAGCRRKERPSGPCP